MYILVFQRYRYPYMIYINAKGPIMVSIARRGRKRRDTAAVGNSSRGSRGSTDERCQCWGRAGVPVIQPPTLIHQYIVGP